MRLGLKQRFLILQLPLLALALTVASFAYRTMNGIESNADIERVNELALLSRAYVAEMGSAMKGYLLNPKDDLEAKRKKESDDHNADALKQMIALTKNPELVAAIAELGELDEKKLNPAEDEVMDLVKKGKLKDAQTVFLTKYLPLRKTYDLLSQRISETSIRLTKEAHDSFVSAVRTSMKTIILLVLVGSLIASTFTMVALSKTSGSLSKVQSHMSSATQSMRREAEGILSVSTSLAEQSSHLSAAIQESVSSMTQISSMLSQTTRNASVTAELSKDVLVEARDGVAVMEDMASSMKSISSSSSRLKEIVKVIDNIAAKTNVINDVVFKTQLLAVNASIEAARAGHHGKGFAVVANEVASLATLSGKASTEIRELLGSSATHVTDIIEGTTRSVQDGERTSDLSSKAFSSIVKSVEAISDKVDQISAASREQESGVSQTSVALSQMNQSTTATNQLAQNNAKLGGEIMKISDTLRAVDKSMKYLVTGSEIDKVAGKKKKHSRLELILNEDQNSFKGSGEAVELEQGPSKSAQLNRRILGRKGRPQGSDGPQDGVELESKKVG